MGKNVNFRMQWEAFEKGDFLESDGSINSRCYNFYDWFCKETSLEKKSIGLFKFAKKVADASGINIDKHYVFFKNNCPMCGRLYDSFSFVNIESDVVALWCTPKSGHESDIESGLSVQFATSKENFELNKYSSRKEMLEAIKGYFR